MIPVLQDDAVLYLLPDHLGVAYWSDDEGDGLEGMGLRHTTLREGSDPIKESTPETSARDAARLQAVRAELLSGQDDGSNSDDENGNDDGVPELE
jgi:hypothetical protein